MQKRAKSKRDTYHVGNLAPQLLSAARELLEQVGPTKLSLRAVSERVGVSSTAAYHHFANRSELISHLAAKGFRELAKALAQLNTGSTAQEKLRSACLAYFSFARRSPALYQLMFGPEFPSNGMIPELAEARAQAFDELRGIVAEIMNADKNSPEIRRAALASWSYTHGLASLVIHDILKFPPDTTDERFVDSTLQGFAFLFQLEAISH